jgi:hypothetical protein
VARSKPEQQRPCARGPDAPDVTADARRSDLGDQAIERDGVHRGTAGAG